MAKNKKIHDAGDEPAELSDEQSDVRSKFGPAVPIKFDTYQALYLLVLIAVSFLIYSNTFKVPFIFDDMHMIKENPSIRVAEIDWTNIKAAVSGMGRNRPVTTISFAVNYYFDQYNLPGYHLFNIGVHIITGILLYFFLKTTLTISNRQNFLASKLNHVGITTVSGLTALLWLVNPVQTQSVTYIVQRTNSMAAMFFILALFLYSKGRISHRKADRIHDNLADNGIQRRPLRHYYFWYLGCVFAGVFAWGSKENSASLPFFILLYEWYFFQDLSKKWLKKQLIFIGAITILFILVALMHLGLDPWEKFKNLRDFSEGNFTLGQRLLTQTRVVLYYLSLIFYPNPNRLNLDYDFPLSHSLLDPLSTLPSLIGIIGLIILSIFLARKQRILSFCIMWFLGNLVIESSIIPLAIIFEHRLYLPSMLIFLLAVMLFYRFIKPHWLSVTVIGVLIAICAFWTFERNKVWQDRISMWVDCIRKSPNKARPYANLANAQKARNLNEEAQQNYLKSLQINPNFTEAHNNLAVLLEEQSNLNVAIQHYLKAVQLKPNFADAHNNLGTAYQKLSKPDKAEEHIRRALQINPNHAKAHNNLGFILADQGKLEEAIVHYRKSLQIDPAILEAHNNIGHALQNQGNFDEAIEHYRNALKIKPDNSEAQFHLAEALINQGKSDQAADHIQKALQIKPNDAQALNNLGGQLLKQGKIDEALEYLTRALSINPDLAEAHNNVGIISIRQGKLTAAISHFQEAMRIDPDFQQANDNLQRALAIRDKMDKEIGKLQEELDIRKNDPVLHFKMGNLYLGKGELNKAVVEFEKALSLHPNFLEAQNNLALVYAANRQYEQALSAFKRLIELDSANASTYYNIAVLYALQNDVPNSIAWLKQAIDRGYQNWDLIKTDKDLANIRHSEGYKRLVEGH